MGQGSRRSSTGTSAPRATPHKSSITLEKSLCDLSDLDSVIGDSRARCSSGDHCLDEPHVRFFENVIAQYGNWTRFKRECGPDTNRAAILARITLRTEDTIRWPDAAVTEQTVTIQGGYRYHVRQGESPRASP